MRLRELEIEHFGILAGRRLTLPGDGLQVVYGPNEAGKSTLLQLIREVLFGFPVRSPYVFPEHAGEMAATATIELADGARIRFRRRKGRAAEVVGEHLTSGEAVDRELLQRYLGHATAELFQHVFGFSLQELSAGEQSLQDAKLSEALYGGALGSLSRFQSVLTELTREHEQLFAPAATKRPINQLLSELKSQQKALKAACLRPRDYAVLVEASRDLAAQMLQLKEQRDALQREQLRCDRLLQAVELWQRRQSLQQELAALPQRHGVSRDAQQQYETLRAQRDQAAAEYAEFQREQERIGQQLQAIVLREEVLAAAARIQQLAQQLERIRGFRADIGKRQQESQQVKAQVASLLRDLDPAWTLDQLDRFRTSLARRCAIETMQREIDELERERRELRSQRPALIADLDSMRQRWQDLADDLVDPALVDTLDHAAAYRAACEQRETCRQQRRELAARADQLRTQLVAPLAGAERDLTRLPVPLPAAVAEFRQRLSTLDQKQDRAELRLEQTQADHAQRAEELALIQAQADVPDRAQLEAARARRDRGWQLVRRRYEVGDAESAEAIGQWLAGQAWSLPEGYEQAVAAADRLADQRQQHAEIVARTEQLAAELTRLDQRCTAATEATAEIGGQRDETLQAWVDLWASCGLVPQSPEVMLDWLRHYRDWQEACSRLTAIDDQIAAVTQSVEDFETRLATLLRGTPGSGATGLAELRRRVKRGAEAAAERKTYAAELPRKERQLNTLERQLADLEERCEQWRQRWHELMRECGFPTAWDVHAATKVLQGLSQAQSQHDLALSLDQRVADMQDGLGAFEQLVRVLCQEVAPTLLASPAENAVEELTAWLDQAREAARDLTHLSSERQRVNAYCAAKQAQREDCDRAIQALFTAAEVADEPEFLEIARRVRQRYEAEDHIERLDQQLRVARGEEDAVRFEAALATADAADLDSRRQLQQREFDQADAAFNQVLQQRGILDERVRALDQATEATAIAQRIEDTRGRLRDAVDQWVPLVLARQFMHRALSRFERDHQPQMLRDVSRLFHQMTLGRYTEITRKLDERGTLQLRQADGRCKEPQHLSTGTREQLYLAIRLAYVLHYCREAEPLPIVMDDVLVNFDDPRAAATLDVLVDMAAQVQVILMTCHRGTLDLVRSRVEGWDLLLLEES